MSEKHTFYKKLKIQLDETTKFPSDYLYKFIVPTSGSQKQEICAIFDSGGAVITTKKSKTGKYVSLSILMKLKSSDAVITYYKKVEKVKGVISL